MPGRRKSSKSTRGKSRKSARRGGFWPLTSETKEECVATCNNKFDAKTEPSSQGSMYDTFKSIIPFASSPPTPSPSVEPPKPSVEPPKPSVEPPKQGGRRSRRRRYRRIKSRIRKRR